MVVVIVENDAADDDDDDFQDEADLDCWVFFYCGPQGFHI